MLIMLQVYCATTAAVGGKIRFAIVSFENSSIGMATLRRHFQNKHYLVVCIPKRVLTCI